MKQEKGTAKFAYACVVTTKDMKKGSVFTEDDIWVKRPGTGEIKAESYFEIINKKASKYIKKNSQLEWNMIEKD